MADGTVLIKTDTFQPTERFQGGTLFRVEEIESGNVLGYSVVLGEDGQGNVVILGSNGNPTRAPLSPEELDERARAGPPGGP